MHHFFRRLLRSRRGATAIEYGLILACIAMALVAAFQAMNARTANIFGRTINAMTG